jgi:hypothetical protein
MASDTRPVSKRDTTMRPAGEIVRRLLFALYIVGGIGGAILAGVGFVRHDRAFIMNGAVGLALAVVLHFTRTRWGVTGLASEIKANPFKPERAPKQDQRDDAGSA